MSIETSTAFRVGPPVAPAPASPAPAPKGTADKILAPIDHLHDRLVGGLAKLGQATEAEAAERGTVLGMATQFAVGALGAVGTMAEGMWQTVRHPIQTLQGLWALASHVPLTPMWLWRLVTTGPARTLGEDGAFFRAVVQGILAPYKKDWQAGRYFAVAGRAAVDIGTLYVGIKQAKTAIDRWRVERAAKAVPEAGLVDTLMGTETRATGQVMGEGTVTIKAAPQSAPVPKAKPAKLTALEHPWARPDKKQIRGADLIEAAKRRAGKHGKMLDTSTPTREALERAANAYPFDRKRGRAFAIQQLERDQDLFRRLRQVGPERLMTDKTVKNRFRMLTRSVDARMDQELTRVLGVQPQGVPKDPLRAAAKLEMWQATDGGKSRLGSLDDLARGRVDLPGFDASRMRQMLKSIRRHFGDENLIVHDYINGKPFYRGRLHVKIRDASGLWYELQVGPKQLSQLYDTPFTAAGRTTNVHDAVYKGLLKLDDEAVKVLGKGDLDKGAARVAKVLDTYVDEVNDVMEVAKGHQPYVFHPQTSGLRRGIADLLDELPEELLPLGLK